MPNRPQRWTPPNSHHQPGKNGERMTVDRGFNRDPLAPKKHYVTVEVEPGQWQIIGNTNDPIEMLRLEVAKDHAIGLQSKNMLIVGDDQVVEDSFHNYIPVPQPEGESIGEENTKIRDRWIASIVKWLIPRDLTDCCDNDIFREEIAAALVEAKAEISVRPDGRAAIIFRDGATLATWAC